MKVSIADRFPRNEGVSVKGKKETCLQDGTARIEGQAITSDGFREGFDEDEIGQL